VTGTDGGRGWITDVRAIPGSGEITGFVLREGPLFDRGVTVPIDAVERTDDRRVHISLSANQLNRLADTHLRNLALPSLVEDRPIKGGQRVVSRDGDVGTLVLVFSDKASNRVTHLVVRENDPSGRDLIVPVELAAEITADPIVLDIDGQGIDRLTEYRPDVEITDAVARTLWHHSDIHPVDLQHVTVRVRDGVVELQGTTRTEESRMLIDALVRSTAGVLGVNNRLETFQSLSAAVQALRQRDDILALKATTSTLAALPGQSSNGGTHAGEVLPQKAVAQTALGADVTRPLGIVA
jgi:osmotically-inducible protein OsmY